MQCVDGDLVGRRLGCQVEGGSLMAAKSSAVRTADLTVAQYAALLPLAQHPGISAAALARDCLVTPQAMTGVLKTLQVRGLIERTAHPWHRRVLETRLTEAGQHALTAADTEAVRIERHLADEFTAEEQDILRALLARCVQAIERDR
ncbi:MarR family winged helix-turn-helix transcriptional regulator [Streptomyces sp. NPDC059832]|uniref:MarR family winged helix-turn-helix transcriptional regulator n=1 Tax=Streptomyces sp. NPDC059832 TaxID=3346966 RepID=UPI003648BFC2